MMVRRMLRLFSVGIIFFFLFSTSLYASIKVSYPRKVYQGNCFWLEVKYSSEVNGILLKYNSKTMVVPLNKQKKSRVILGVSAKEKKDRLFWIYYQEKGKFFKEKYKIKILKKNFSKQYLKLPKKFVYFSKKDLKRIKKEKYIVNRILNTVTPYSFLREIQLPVRSKVLSPFGVKRILNGEERSYHRGVDFRAPLNTPIRAFARGKVVLAKSLFFGGNTLILDHGLGIYSLYMHLNQFRTSLGKVVEKGEVIGLAGSSGRATGPHLHFGLFVLGEAVNPLSLF